MSETKFTKGPWGIEYDGHEANIIGPVPYTSDQRDIAYVNSEVGDIDGFACGVTAQANAHLIAAAPELYAALDNLRFLVANYGDFSNGVSHNGVDEGRLHAMELVIQANKALKKARGEG